MSNGLCNYVGDCFQKQKPLTPYFIETWDKHAEHITLESEQRIDSTQYRVNGKPFFKTYNMNLAMS